MIEVTTVDHETGERVTRELGETSRTETTVRQLDADGRLIVETTTTVVVRKEQPERELPTGMYL